MANVSIYPKAIDGYEQLPLAVDGVTPVDAVSVTSLRSAIINIENELGVMPSSGFQTVADRLNELDAGGPADFDQLQQDIEQLQEDVGNLQTDVGTLQSDVDSIESELGANPSGIFPTVADRLDDIESSGASSILKLVTSVNILEGDLLKINSSGEVEKADANTGLTNDARVIGASAGTFLATSTADIKSSTGQLIPVTFISIPGAGSNGSPVYLSNTPGEATLIPPTAPGTIIFMIGILQGADGASTTVDVLFQPMLVAGNG